MMDAKESRILPQSTRKPRLALPMLGAILALILVAPAGAAPADATVAATSADPSMTIETTDLGDPLVIVDTPTQRFEVKIGESWHDALTRWSAKSGYTLIWRAPTDLLVEAPIVFDQGTTFEGALDEVLRTLWHSRNALVGSLYRNHVLVITGKDA
jgi:hypothetical protein